MSGTPKTLQQAVQCFTDYVNCKDYMVALRWPNGVHCPRCGSAHVVYLDKARVWKCYEKHSQAKFTLKTGTIFEDSPLGLDKWLVAVWMIANCKNGISSWELHRALGVTQKTAWFMLHRVRLAMQDELGGLLAGEIEVDETFIGGKARNMHKDRKERAMRGKKGGPATGSKAIVVGMLVRNGKVRSSVVPDRGKEVIQSMVMGNIEPGSQIHSDEHARNWRMDDLYEHVVVNHLEAYVQGNVHTNGLENFWSLLKRSLSGTYVSVEPFHLFRYVDEQAFRYNNRKPMDDQHRFTYLLRKIVNKRLTYAELTGKVGETAGVVAEESPEAGA